MKDAVAIVGVGSTGYVRDAHSTRLSLAVRAAVAALEDAGIRLPDVDGICGTNPDVLTMSSTLGLPRVHYYANQLPPVGFSLLDASRALYAKACDVVLMVHSVLRPGVVGDPMRAASDPGGGVPLRPLRNQPLARSGAGTVRRPLELLSGGLSYPAWAGRYLHDRRLGPRAFASIVRNSRFGARLNPLAVFREQIETADYESSRIVTWPLALLDYEIAADGADAFVLIRADDVTPRQQPVLIHAGVAVLQPMINDAQLADLAETSMHWVGEELRAMSDLELSAADLYYLYDGFSFLVPLWAEALGLCAPGGGLELFDAGAECNGCVRLGGGQRVNTHGGSLAEGASQGSGHLREAVQQIRGDLGPRQEGAADSAVVALGGPFFNSQGFVLRSG